MMIVDPLIQNELAGRLPEAGLDIVPFGASQAATLLLQAGLVEAQRDPVTGALTLTGPHGSPLGPSLRSSLLTTSYQHFLANTPRNQGTALLSVAADRMRNAPAAPASHQEAMGMTGRRS
jgi:hypothetical protein